MATSTSRDRAACRQAAVRVTVDRAVFLDAIGRAHALGVKIVVGVDLGGYAVNPTVFAREFAVLVEAGMTVRGNTPDDISAREEVIFFMIGGRMVDSPAGLLKHPVQAPAIP